MRRPIDGRLHRTLGATALTALLGTGASADAIRSTSAPRVDPRPIAAEAAPDEAATAPQPGPSGFDPARLAEPEARPDAPSLPADADPAVADDQEPTAVDPGRPTLPPAPEPAPPPDPASRIAADPVPGDAIRVEQPGGVPAPSPSPGPAPGREAISPAPRIEPPIEAVDPEALRPIDDPMPGPARRPGEFPEPGLAPQSPAAGDPRGPIDLALGEFSKLDGDRFADPTEPGVLTRDLLGDGDPLPTVPDPAAGWNTDANLGRLFDAAIGAEVRRRMFQDVTPDPAEVAAEVRGLPIDPADDALAGQAASPRGGTIVATPEPSSLILIGLAALITRLGDPRRRSAAGAPPGGGR